MFATNTGDIYQETITGWCSRVNMWRNKCLRGHGQTSNSLISPFPKQVSHQQGDPAGCTNLRDELASRSSPQHSSVHLRRKHVRKQCGKSRSQGSFLDAQGPIHTRGKAGECPLCRKVFNNYFSLRWHRMIHTGEKPYKCSLWETATRVHTGETRFEHHVCGKLSKVPTWHMRKHSGEKPCKCRLCEKSFHQISYLRKHKTIHPKEKHYECCQRGSL